MVKLIQADRPVVLWPSGQPSGPSARRGGTHGRCSRDRLRSLIPSSMGGGDEKALPSRRQPTWGATQKGVKAEGVAERQKLRPDRANLQLCKWSLRDSPAS